MVWVRMFKCSGVSGKEACIGAGACMSGEQRIYIFGVGIRDVSPV